MTSSTLTSIILPALAVLIPLLAFGAQLRKWRKEDADDHRKEREEDIEARVKWETQISRDIEGNTQLILGNAKKLDDHETKCDERWQKNWADHDEFRSELGILKGKAG